MRISDWSSDVCSSDLTRLAARYLWQPVGLLLLVASFAQGDRCENLTGEKRHRCDRIAKLFRHHRRVEQGHAEPAMLFGDEHSGNAQIVEGARSEEHTSELQSLMRISYAVFCLKKTKEYTNKHT